MVGRRLAGTCFLAVWCGAVGLTAQDLLRPTGPPPQWESCEELHDTYLKRFESTDGMGLSRMYRAPMRDLSGSLDTGRARYSLVRLELIGCSVSRRHWSTHRSAIHPGRIRSTKAGR